MRAVEITTTLIRRDRALEERPSFDGLCATFSRKREKGKAYWFFSVWFMISRASKLMPQVGKELPTK
ncbi:MAG: hypothetical protein WAL59_21525, partial [Roseiarcus sp.]